MRIQSEFYSRPRMALVAAVGLIATGALLLGPLATAALADDGIDSGDTAWMLVSCALVMLMTPGLALFYGGMSRTKNVLSTMMYSFIALGAMTIQWVVIGYSLAFAPDAGGGFIGGLDHMFLNGIEAETPSDSIPAMVFCMFQLMFAIITPALISGAVVGRMKFSTYIVFIVLWGTLVYDPICHWVWGPDGWLGARGALDFAGGTVVHLSSGISALVIAFVLGARKGWPDSPMIPHNLTMTALGAALLWFGWYGFNAGSALTSGAGAGAAFGTTHIAASAAAFSWAVVEWMHRGKPSMLGVATGIVAGLVCITPAAGFVSPMGALIMGLVISPICYFAIAQKTKFKYDDSLDAFGVHGVGGASGAILTGIFAAEAWGGAGGLLEGNGGQLVEQIIAVVATIIYAVVVTFIILKVLDAVMGLRTTEDEEVEGLDLALHGERGYVND